MHNTSATSNPLPDCTLPSAFQPGQPCLLSLGHVHLPFYVRRVLFGEGKVYYEGEVTDQYGTVTLTVPSERCARGMDTMLDYMPVTSAPGAAATLSRIG